MADPTLAGAINVITYPGTTSSQSTNLTSINGTAPTLGAGLNASGLLVALPTDQSVAVTGTVTATGTLTLSASSGTGTLSATSVIISSTTATVVKASPGVVYGVSIDNNSAGPVYAKLYNATSATAGSGTPAMRLMCAGPTNGGGAVRDWDNTIGVNFGTGICLIVTQLIGDADTTAVPASTVTVNIFWH